MTDDAHPDEVDRLDALLADSALIGLTPAEREELDRLLALVEGTDRPDPESFDRTAAAAALALGPGAFAPSPARLRAALDRDAARMPGMAASPARSRSKVGRALPWLGWAVAAGLLAGLWVNRPASVEAPEVRRRALLADPATARVEWSGVGPKAKVSGDVAWNSARQEGYMRLAGLAANDPAKSQYQLWIFDDARDRRFPVDGGIFDVPARGGDVVVPIAARLAVVDPSLFAITVEQPGGVVVSDRSGLVATAIVTRGR